jgi:glutathione S-transferase
VRLEDIKNFGVQAIASDGDFTTVKDAVDFHLRQLADYLIYGNGATLPAA